MRKPNFFIVGAPKSGTTALYHYLKLHPDIFLPEVKEPHFFGADLYFKKNWYNNDEHQYLSYFEGAKNEKRVGEASTSYLYSLRAAEEIKKFSPKADIIIILRSPPDMMYSLHSEMLFDCREDIHDFKKALEAGKKDKKKNISRRKNKRKWLYYRDAAKYSGQVKRYIDIFGPQKVHIIIFDDFIKDTEREYAKVLEFLKVDKIKIDFNKINTDTNTNPNKRARIWILQKFIEEPPSLLRTVSKYLIPQKTRYRFVKRATKLNTKYQPRVPLDNKLRQSLLKEFRPEIDRLGRLIHRDLSFWYKQ